MAFNFDPQWVAGLFGGGGALAFVVAEYKGMKTEIKECRKRDADVVIVMAGVQLLVGKMKRDEPESIELAMFGDLLSRRLGPPPSIDDFHVMLKRIDDADRSEDDE